jgi:iron complex outermembrane receptor protein
MWRSAIKPRDVLGLSVVVFAFLTAPAHAEPERRIDVEAGEAAEMLMEFASQADVNIVFDPRQLEGVQTNRVVGEFLPSVALEQMLEGTMLVANREQDTGAVAISQRTAPATDDSPAANPINRFFKSLFAGTAANKPEGRSWRPASTEEEIFELSPFTVDVTTDNGYVASQTLAGSRIAAPLRNVAAQIDVMTGEFLQDVGAVSLDEAMLYSLNVENSNEYNPNPERDSEFGVYDLSTAGRVRGISNATRTLNYFPTFFTHDTYNTERFTFNSGPNAILFGLGSPGGVMDSTGLKAYFTNRTSIDARFDSEGSLRGQVRFNRVLVEKKLAISIAALHEDAESWQKPSFDRKERYHGTFTFKPFARTTIRGSYERIDRETTWPRNTAMRDYATPYLNWRAAKMKEQGISDPRDPRLYWAPGDPADDSTPFQLTGKGIRLITGSYDPVPEAFLIGDYWSSLERTLTGTGEGFQTTGSALSRGPQELAGVHPADVFTRSLADPSLFPPGIHPSKALLAESSGSIWSIFAEQQLTDQLFVEAAVQVEDRTKEHEDWLRGYGQALRVDVNRYLPQEVGSVEPPVLNPNRGRYFMEEWGQGNFTDVYSENARLTIAYELDLEDREDWLSWLGRHQFTLLADYSRVEVGTQNYRTSMYPEYTDGIPIPGEGAAAFGFRVLHRVYLDDPADPGGSIFTFDPAVHVTQLLNEPFAGYDNVHVTLRPDPHLEYGVWGGGRFNTSETRGRVFAVQSSFLQDRLHITYGRRWDYFKFKEVTTPLESNAPAPWNTRPRDISKLSAPGLSEPDIDASGYQETRGLVFHALPWFSVFYNESENQQAKSAGLNLLTGELHPPSDGLGKDYGFLLNLSEGELLVKVNWFETIQRRNESIQFSDLRWAVWEVESRLTNWSESNSVPAPPGAPFNPPTTWDPNTTADISRADILSDARSEGIEIKLHYNPAPNWRMVMTVARTEVVEENIATTYSAYVDSRLGEWRKYYDRAWDRDGMPAEPGEETLEQFVEREIFMQELDLAAAYEGRPADRVSKWRVNLVSNYTFTDGFLKGFSLGGAYRWRDERVIGFPLTTGEEGNEVFDIHHPWKGSNEWNLDAWIAYDALLFNGKAMARFQVNIQNLLDEDGIIPQKALTSGEVAIYRWQAPRRFIFSASLAF